MTNSMSLLRPWIYVSALLYLVCLDMPTRARAEERVLHESLLIQTGVICDKLEEIREALDMIERTGQPEDAVKVITGCGFVVRPFVARVVLIEKRSFTKNQYAIVRYEFFGIEGAVQFGVFGILTHEESVRLLRREASGHL